jgi:hypothetical protein
MFGFNKNYITNKNIRIVRNIEKRFEFCYEGENKEKYHIHLRQYEQNGKETNLKVIIDERAVCFVNLQDAKNFFAKLLQQLEWFEEIDSSERVDE